MAPIDHRIRVRIFLSSPSDVAEERRLAAELIDAKLRKDPGIAGSFLLELVRWDDPETPTPHGRASAAPGLSELDQGQAFRLRHCHTWSRLGSPFQLDGRQWASGTQWEYEDVRGGAKSPHLLLYRRTAKPQIDLDAPDFDTQRAQYERVKQFFAEMAGVNDYAQPSELVARLEAHLRELLAKFGAPSLHRPFASSVLDRFGIAALAPAAFRAGAEGLIASYLGADERPLPFGGRDAMLRRLDAWLADVTSRRLLLWAPAGRGKSALVTHWLAGLGASCHLIFLPVSARFATNRAELFYHALAARLAALLAVELPVASTDPLAHYRGFAIDFLRRTGELDRPALLVIDGLDEAAGWQFEPALLPPTLPPALRILVSARIQAGDVGPAGWLGRLGWMRLGAATAAMEVPGLDRTEIEDVIHHAPAISTGIPELAAELARLTDGDPLLIALYIDELTTWAESGRIVTAAALAKVEPGFGALFRRWLDDQESLWQAAGVTIDRATVDLLFSILACALGPLRHTDLASLCRHLRSDSFTLPRHVLQPIARFLQGDGEGTGYVLSHPKLGDYLRREYFGDERILAAAREAFLAWGRWVTGRLNGGELSPDRCPTYLLLYYTAHLESASAALSDWSSLAENGWRLAHEHLEGGPSGFGGTVADVLGRACRRGWTNPSFSADAIGIALRCSLILASLQSIGVHTPPELLLAAADKGALSHQQALYLASIAGPFRFSIVAAGLLHSGDEHGNSGLVTAALAAACSISNEDDRATALASLAPHLSEGQLGQALAAAHAITNDALRPRALTHYVSHMNGPQLAEEFADSLVIGDEQFRARALTAVAPGLNEFQLAQAFAAALTIGDEHCRATALSGLAPYLKKSQLAEALAETRAIRIEYCRANALTGLAPRLSDHQISEALAAARAICDEDDRARALAGLAPYVSDSDRPQALTNISAIRDEYDRAMALIGLARRLNEPQLVYALVAARAIGDERCRAKALAGLAPYLSKTQLAEALAIACTIGGESYRARALVGLAPYLRADGHSDLMAEALAAARALSDEEGRGWALSGLAPHLGEPERSQVLAEALGATRDFGYQRYRTTTLAQIAPYLSVSQLAETLAKANAIRDEIHRAKVLADIPLFLNDGDRTQAVAEALAIARAISDVHPRSAALARLAPQLQAHDRAPVITEILAATRSIDHDRYSLTVLPEVALDVSELQSAEYAKAFALHDTDGRAKVLASIGPYLSEVQLAEGLAEARTTRFEIERASILVGLAPYLGDVQLAEALAVARAIGRESIRASVLASLAPFLNDYERLGVLSEALATAGAISDSYARTMVLVCFAPHLSDPQLSETLAAAGTIDESSRARVLSGVAPYLSQAQLAEALAAARAIDHEDSRARALAGVAPYLRQAQLTEALAAARAIGDEKCRATALTDLTPLLSEDERPDLLAEALAAARAIDNEFDRAAALADLAPNLSEDERTDLLAEALAAACAICDEDDRAIALGKLAPHLPLNLQSEALSHLMEVAGHVPRSLVLETLAALLPAIAQLGGSPALGELRRGIRDTAEWYP